MYNVGGKRGYRSQAMAGIFGQVDASSNSERNPDRTANSKNYGRANDRVSHSAPDLSDGLRRMRQEGPIHRSGALDHEIGENCYQRPNDDGRDTRRQTRSQLVSEAPAKL